MTDLLMMLAQTSQAAPGQTGPGAPPAFNLFEPPFFTIILIIAIFYFFLFRSQSGERRKHQNMLNGLKRNDRVLTIGGIIATVVEVRDAEVILKVDEANNVKMRFSRSAIKDVFKDAAGDAEAGKKK